MGVYYFYGLRPAGLELGLELLTDDGSWQDMGPEQQGHLRHDKVLGDSLGVRSPVGGPSS
jgi:hypothetical protein